LHTGESQGENHNRGKIGPHNARIFFTTFNGPNFCAYTKERTVEPVTKDNYNCHTPLKFFTIL
jgi:hypothetical protein